MCEEGPLCRSTGRKLDNLEEIGSNTNENDNDQTLFDNEDEFVEQHPSTLADTVPECESLIEGTLMENSYEVS